MLISRNEWAWKSPKESSTDKALAGPQGDLCLLDIREPQGQARRPDAGNPLKAYRVGQISLVTSLWGYHRHAGGTFFSFSVTTSFFL